ncbi:hypothetical protein CASFOL_009908 [Castilleja foliolosa]|uniref:Uncharacterized protein n=1 Tax=Castilleja foliolosa TaxID=1961234 RepID=A0ABD3DR10_9LAMI
MGNFLKSIATVFFALMLIFSAGRVAGIGTGIMVCPSREYKGHCNYESSCKKFCGKTKYKVGYCKDLSTCVCSLC